MNQTTSHRSTHVAALRCDATPTCASPSPNSQFLSPSEKTHLHSDPQCPPPTHLSPALPSSTPTTALTAVSCQQGQILTCSASRIRAPTPPPLPPPLQPSLNGDYVQQSSLLSNQRIPQKRHLLVMTLLFSEHAGFGWLCFSSFFVCQ